MLGSWTAPLCGEVFEARDDALSGVASGDPGSHSLKGTRATLGLGGGRQNVPGELIKWGSFA